MSRHLIRLGGIIIALVLLDVSLISLVFIAIDASTVSLQLVWGHFQFFVFQKGPIFTLAYICLAVFAHYQHQNQILTLRIQSMSSLKEEDLELYEEWKNKWSDETKLIRVKTGNRISLISLDEITWIGSDNYCVNIHTREGQKYTLRSSMKRMEGLLPDHLFLRIHRTAIINVREIREITIGNQPSILLHSGTSLEIAMSRLPDIRGYLDTLETERKLN